METGLGLEAKSAGKVPLDRYQESRNHDKWLVKMDQVAIGQS
jgi:hypothetical protein